MRRRTAAEDRIWETRFHRRSARPRGCIICLAKLVTPATIGKRSSSSSTYSINHSPSSSRLRVSSLGACPTSLVHPCECVSHPACGEQLHERSTNRTRLHPNLSDATKLYKKTVKEQIRFGGNVLTTVMSRHLLEARETSLCCGFSGPFKGRNGAMFQMLLYFFCFSFHHLGL